MPPCSLSGGCCRLDVAVGDLIPEWCGGGGIGGGVVGVGGPVAAASPHVIGDTQALFTRSVWYETMRGGAIVDRTFVPRVDNDLAETFGAMAPMVRTRDPTTFGANMTSWGVPDKSTLCSRCSLLFSD